MNQSHPTAAGPPSGYAARLSLEAGGERWDVEVRTRGPATGRDVVRAVTGARGSISCLWVDGQEVDPDLPFGPQAFPSGCRIVVAKGPARAADPEPNRALADLVVCAGPGSGTRCPVAAGRLVVGRHPAAHVDLQSTRVSSRHAGVHVTPGGATLEDLGSPAGTIVDGHRVNGRRAWPRGSPAILGDVVVRLEPRPGRPDRASGQTNVVHRPPRRATRSTEPPLTVPAAPEPPERRTPPGPATMLIPVAFALVAAVVFTPMMAIFALMGPLMMGAAWLDEQVRGRRAAREASRQAAVERRAFNAAMGAQAQRALAAHRATPDLAELVRRARDRDRRLWERRPDHDDFLCLPLGLADLPWAPALIEPARPDPPSLARARRGQLLRSVPAVAPLRRGATLGVVGPPARRDAVARGLVLAAATAHGPADLAIAVPARDGWRWAQWLPHRAPGAPACRVVDATVDATVDAAVDATDGEPVDDDLTIVLARRVEDLPACTDLVVELPGETGPGRLVHLRDSHAAVSFLPAEVDVELADSVARQLAPLVDPMLPASTSLPEQVGFDEIIDPADADALMRRWAESSAHVGGRGVPFVVGVDDRGPVELDLCADGPHALVGGTTGSGKSELLRTLVASLAAMHPPTKLSFLLVDYKGGSAFDACAGLPHVTGVITDLDVGLAERALACLRAEVRRRELLLRENPRGELGRLVIVCDEFAALASEIPEFVDALVDIAQRGRSLGIHLVLATQRPAGVITEAIRANTNLRIALRTQDDHDSRDVVGTVDAAAISRDLPGRALVRTGRDEQTAIQTACVSGAFTRAPVTVTPLPGSPSPIAGRPAAAAASALEVLRDTACAAAARRGDPPPYRPFTDPLPADLGPIAPVADDALTIGLLDDPDKHARPPLSWNPRAAHLLIVGGRRSGRATAALAIASAWADSRPGGGVTVLTSRPDRFSDAARWPHVAGVVSTGDDERFDAVLADLEDRVARGGSSSPPSPCLLIVDGLAAESSFSDLATIERTDRLVSILRAGLDRHVSCVITSRGPTGVPHALSASCATQVVLRLDDPLDYAVAGARPATSSSPGRGVDPASGLECQLFRPRAVEPGPKTVPDVAVIPERVSLEEVLGAGPGARSPAGASPREHTAVLAVAVDRRRAPVHLVMAARQHGLISGPAGAGKTTALESIRLSARVCGLPTVSFDPDSPAEDVVAALAGAGPLLVLIDDADRLDDPAGHIGEAITRAAPGVHVVAALRTSAPVGFSHFSRRIARDQVGLALWPDRTDDAELWRARLPESPALRHVPGRALALSRDQAVVCQVALPDRALHRQCG